MGSDPETFAATTIFRDMKMLRRSVPGTVSGCVWGRCHHPRIHASDLPKGAQGGRTFTNGIFGRKQRAAYGSGMGRAWFGLGGYEAGGNHWQETFFLQGTVFTIV